MQVKNILLLFLAVLLLVPVFLSHAPYYFRIIIMLLFYIALSQAWNIVGGLARQPFIGVAGFLGFGAYMTILLAKLLLLPPILTMWIGGVCSLALAVIISPILKLRADFLAIGSLTIPGILYSITYNSEILGSCNGIAINPDILYSLPLFYYLGLILTGVLCYIFYRLQKSDFGLRLAAIGCDQDLAEATGISVFSAKFMAFLLTAFFTGILGGFYGYLMLAVLPDDVYNLFWGIQLLLICVIGGIGTVYGPIIGGAIFFLASHFIQITFVELHKLFLGIILIMVVVFFPEGIIGIDWKKIFSKLKG